MDIPRIERYLAKAKECERLGTQARDPMVKATYRLAEQIRDAVRPPQLAGRRLIRGIRWDRHRQLGIDVES